MNILAILKYLHNPFIFAPVLGVIVVIAYMVDAKIAKRDRDRTDYLKLFGTIVATVLGSHFFLKTKSLSQASSSASSFSFPFQLGGSSSAPSQSHHQSHYTPSYTETVHRSPPVTAPLFSSSDVYAENPKF